MYENLCMHEKVHMCLCESVSPMSGHFICVFPQSETRGGVCRSPLLSYAVVL